MNIRMPQPGAPISGPGGLITREWRDFLMRLAGAEVGSGLQDQIDQINARLAEIGGDGAFLPATTMAYGESSVASFGTLSGGLVTFTLQNDVDSPGESFYYGTGADGAKGWFPLELKSLKDVDAVNPNDGDALVWSDSDQRWIAASVSFPFGSPLTDESGNILTDQNGSILTDGRLTVEWSDVNDFSEGIDATSPITKSVDPNGVTVIGFEDAPPDGDGYVRKNGAWVEESAGTVTSVGVSVPTGFYTTGSPVTSSGSIGIVYSDGYQAYTTAESEKLADLRTDTLNTSGDQSYSGVKTAMDKSVTPTLVISGEGGGATSYEPGCFYSDSNWGLLVRANTSSPGVAHIATFSGSGAGLWQVSLDYSFVPSADNDRGLGGPLNRWSQVFSANGTINTSDAREKYEVRELTTAEVAAAVALSKEIRLYQWKDSVARKGPDRARWHCGMTVQRAMDVMRQSGIPDPTRYAFICYDEWQEKKEVRSTDGHIVQEARQSGNRYSFRLDQLNEFISRGLSKRNEDLSNQVQARYAKTLTTATNGQITIDLPYAGMVISVTPRTPDCVISGIAQSVVSGQPKATITFRRLRSNTISLLNLISLSLFETSPGAVSFDIIAIQAT